MNLFVSVILLSAGLARFDLGQRLAGKNSTDLADSSCFQIGSWHPFFDIPIHKTAESPTECQKLCQDVVDCTWWQWISNEKTVKEKKLRGLCSLKTCKPPAARMGYSDMRIRKCKKTMCKDQNGAGGYVTRGDEEVYYDPKGKVTSAVMKKDPRTYAALTYNGPKNCGQDAKLSDCVDKNCAEYNVNYLGDPLPEGQLSFGWDALNPFGQCHDACSRTNLCQSFTMVYAPEWSQPSRFEPWKSPDAGPYYCTLHGSHKGRRDLNNSYAAPETCKKCAKADVTNMTATGKIMEVAASTEELYQHIVDNCDSSSPLTGSYKESVQNEVTITSTYELDSTMTKTFTHSLTTEFETSLDCKFECAIGFDAKLGFKIGTSNTVTSSSSQTTKRINSETKKKVTSVEAGFSYEVPGGRKLKIQSSSKRLDGVLPWTANARCLDKDGKMIEEKNIFGNYKSYGLSTSKVKMKDMPCMPDPDDGGDDDPTGPCDGMFSPPGMCKQCGRSSEATDDKPNQFKWTCTDGCDDGQCACVPPLHRGEGMNECLGDDSTKFVRYGNSVATHDGMKISFNHGEPLNIEYQDWRSWSSRNEIPNGEW